jgi:arsenate reductase (thioredoxin)
MNPSVSKVLILCTGNSARSIVAESLLRAKGAGRFEVYSAGAKPTGRVNPLALWVLREHYGIEAGEARSKSWDEFKDVKFDLVITVCDNARESCPIWPGRPKVAHWSSPDPAACDGAEERKRRLFVAVADQIARRIDRLCALSEAEATAARIQAIGDEEEMTGEAELAR